MLSSSTCWKGPLSSPPPLPLPPSPPWPLPPWPLPWPCPPASTAEPDIVASMQTLAIRLTSRFLLVGFLFTLVIPPRCLGCDDRKDLADAIRRRDDRDVKQF